LEDEDADLDLEHALPVGMLSLSDEDVNEGGFSGAPLTSFGKKVVEPPLTSTKPLAPSPPMELNARAQPYLPPSQSFRGPWTGMPSSSVPSRHMSSPPPNPVPITSSRTRGYFNQPPMMSQLGRGVKAVE